MNSTGNSVRPGEYLSLFGTGFGPVHSPPPDGHPAPLDSLRILQTVGGVAIAGQTVAASFGGRAPGLIGVDQVNVRVPEDAPEGCSIPVQFRGANGSSQPVAVSVSREGGACREPAAESIGILRWSKVFSSGGAPSSRFTAEFLRGAGWQLPEPDAPVPSVCGTLYHPGPSCPEFETARLNAGALILDPPSGPEIRIVPQPGGYSVELPAIAAGGVYAVRGEGGTHVGVFESTVRLPAPLTVTSAFPPDGVLPSDRSLTVTWTGGDADANVTMRGLARIGSVYGSTHYCDVSVPATAGRAVLSPFHGSLPLPRSGDVEVILRVSPRGESASTFQAAGLTRDGVHTWSYEYRFTGLSLR